MQDSESSFFKDVHEVAKLIPSGRVTSYGAIANYLGLRKSARMVGWAMNQSIGDPEVPAHRVVNRNGLLSGKNHFSGGPHEMERLLKVEGVRVVNDQVQDFGEVFWDPALELGIS